MKQTVLKKPLACVRKQLCAGIILCVVAVILTLSLNIVLVLSVTDRTNLLFCLLNIASDAICGIFVISFFAERIVPLRNLCRIAGRPKTDYSGTVRSLSQTTTRYMDMDCIALTVDDRKLYVPAATLLIRAGETYRFRLVSDLVMEAEQ